MPIKISLKFVVSVLVLLAIFGSGYYLITNRSTSESLPEQSISKAEVRDIQALVEVDSNIAAAREYELFIPNNAKITKANKQINDTVLEGDIILEYEMTSITNAKTTTKIEAPFASKIVKFEAKENEIWLSSLTPAFKLVEENKYIIKATINEIDILQIKPEQNVDIVFPAISRNEIFKGKVVNVGSYPEGTAGVISYLVEVEPLEVPDTILIGMSAELSIITDNKENVLSILENNLIEKGDRYFVKKINYQNTDKTEFEIVEQEVTIGLRTNRFVEVLSGLEENDEIVSPNFTTTRSFSFFN